MPDDAVISKGDAASALGAAVHRREGTVDECVAAARERADEGGLAFVHPFDDLDVVAGQGTLGLELLEDVPDLARLVVPVGGGGLASGVAIAVKRDQPEVEVIGVQVDRCAPYLESLDHGEPRTAGPAGPTIADGIAVKRPGEVTLPLVAEWLDGMAAVSEESVAEAMVFLLERARLVVEGAGAVGVAALLSGEVAPAARGRTVVVLSGGNVDAGLLAALIRRHETEAGRRLVVLTRVSDRPGGLARLLATVAGAGANLLDVQHVREGLELHVRETAVELVLETRGGGHAERVLAALGEEGYEVEALSREFDSGAAPT
jgi:threonine dehydratase